MMKKIFTVLMMTFVTMAATFAAGPRKEPVKETLNYQEYVNNDFFLYVGNKHKEVEEWYVIFDDDLQDFFKILDDDPNWVLGDEFKSRFKQLDKAIYDGDYGYRVFDALAVEGFYLYNISNHGYYIDVNVVYVETDKKGNEKLVEYTYVYGCKPAINKMTNAFLQYLDDVNARQKAYTELLMKQAGH